jgi:allantoicase
MTGRSSGSVRRASLTGVDVDTSFFTGNYPSTCRVEACGVEGYPSPGELADDGTEWIEVVPESRLKGDGHNMFPVSDPRRFTHVRLSIHPDAGVARLQVHGEVVPDPRHWDGVTIDLADCRHELLDRTLIWSQRHLLHAADGLLTWVARG